MTRIPRILSRALTVLALASTLVARSSYADDSGWFDDSTQPAASNAPAPAAPSRTVPPPLEPSPLLEDKTVDAEDDSDDRDPRALTEFREELDPYGSWADDPSYGRVWVPHQHVVGSGFQPYVSGGHWALDDHDEWVWVSDYPFGHIVFHYGRWVWASPRGWVWIPGYRYAPAWVVWRVPTGGSSYVGWAPAPPTFVWFGGVSVFWGYDPYYAWVFCPSAYVFSYHVHYHVVRDRYWMGYAARHTVPYRAPRASASSSRARPVSPPPETAGVPRTRVPRERFTRGTATPAARGSFAPSRATSGTRRSFSQGGGGASPPREVAPAPRPRVDRGDQSPAARPRVDRSKKKSPAPRTEKAAPPRPRPERARPDAPRPSSPGKVRRPSFGSDRPSLKDRPRPGSSGFKSPRKR